MENLLTFVDIKRATVGSNTANLQAGAAYNAGNRRLVAASLL